VRHVIEQALAEAKNPILRDVRGEIFVLQAMFPSSCLEQPAEDPLLAFKATSDPDTMYMHQAQKEQDWKQFRKAMQKEWDDQLNNGNFELIKRSAVPKWFAVLPTVWQMRRKRDIMAREVKKWNSVRTLWTITAERELYMGITS